MINYIFDLDNTLYPPNAGIMRKIDERINRFMIEKVGIPEREVDKLRQDYRKRYGVTLNGLMFHHLTNPSDYLEYVHDINYDKYIKKDRKLRKILKNINGYCAVFTNGSKAHAVNVLNTLGVIDCFSDIFSIEDAGYNPKPNKESYCRFIEITGIDPSDSIFFEDMHVNLESAGAIGFKTALVWGEYDSQFDYYFSSIYDIIDLNSQV
jgi:putative hydrolase of the HAD superfamily